MQRTLFVPEMSSELKHPEFHHRLSQLIGAEHPYAWASRVGISKGAFTRIWKEGTMPGAELLQRIAASKGVSIDWLLLGRGQPFAAAPFNAPVHVLRGEELRPAAEPAAEPASDAQFVGIPLYRLHAAAGHGPAVGQDATADVIAFKREWIRRELHCEPQDLYMLYVEGESMEPVLRSRDIVLVDRRNAEKIPQDGIYVVRLNGSLLVKRVQRLPGGVLRVTSENASYEPFTVKLSDPAVPFIVIGRIIWAGRRY